MHLSDEPYSPLNVTMSNAPISIGSAFALVFVIFILFLAACAGLSWLILYLCMHCFNLYEKLFLCKQPFNDSNRYYSLHSISDKV